MHCRHTSRFLIVFLTFLPFALWSYCGWLTPGVEVRLLRQLAMLYCDRNPNTNPKPHPKSNPSLDSTLMLTSIVACPPCVGLRTSQPIGRAPQTLGDPPIAFAPDPDPDPDAHTDPDPELLHRPWSRSS